MKSSTLKMASHVGGGLLLLTTFACAGLDNSLAGGGSGLSGSIRVANVSNVSTIDTNITSQNKTTELSAMLPTNSTTCPKTVPIVVTPNPVIEITAGGSTVNLLTEGEPLTTDNGTQSLFVYGPSNNLKIEYINSLEGPGGMEIFVADLSIADTATYQVIIKDLINNTQTQTTPVSGIDGSRHIAFPVTVASNYEVDLVSGGTLKASGMVTVSPTEFFNAVMFTDNGSGGFLSHTFKFATGCVAP